MRGAWWRKAKWELGRFKYDLKCLRVQGVPGKKTLISFAHCPHKRLQGSWARCPLLMSADCQVTRIRCPGMGTKNSLQTSINWLAWDEMLRCFSLRRWSDCLLKSPATDESHSPFNTCLLTLAFVGQAARILGCVSSG